MRASNVCNKYLTKNRETAERRGAFSLFQSEPLRAIAVLPESALKSALEIGEAEAEAKAKAEAEAEVEAMAEAAARAAALPS